MDAGINEEQGEVNAGRFQTDQPEPIHTVKKISRQCIFSDIKPHPCMSYYLAARKFC